MKPRDGGAKEICPRHHRTGQVCGQRRGKQTRVGEIGSAQVGIGQLRGTQSRVGEILPAEVPAGQVVAPQLMPCKSFAW